MVLLERMPEIISLNLLNMKLKDKHFKTFLKYKALVYHFLLFSQIVVTRATVKEYVSAYNPPSICFSHTAQERLL